MEEPKTPLARRLDSLGARARAAAAHARWGEVLALTDEALGALRSHVTKPTDTDVADVQALADHLSVRASALGSIGRVHEAVATADMAYNLCRLLTAEDPAHRARHRDEATAVADIGDRWRADLPDDEDLLEYAHSLLLEVVVDHFGISHSRSRRPRAERAWDLAALAVQVESEHPDEAGTARSLRLGAHELFTRGSELREPELVHRLADFGPTWLQVLLLLARQDRATGDVPALQEHQGWLAGLVQTLVPHALTNAAVRASVTEGHAFLAETGFASSAATEALAAFLPPADDPAR